MIERYGWQRYLGDTRSNIIENTKEALFANKHKSGLATKTKKNSTSLAGRKKSTFVRCSAD